MKRKKKIRISKSFFVRPNNKANKRKQKVDYRK